MQQPLEIHWKAVKRILRYLNGTLTFGVYLKCPTNLNITGFSDADWASDIDDIRSTTGYCVFLGGNLISWQSKKQQVISRSSSEAEYRGLAALVADVSWIQSLLTELQLSSCVPVVYCDNLSTVQLSHNPILHSRTKHMELDIFFVRDKVLQKQLQVHHIPSLDQPVDLLTKALSFPRFDLLRSKLSVINFAALKNESH